MQLKPRENYLFFRLLPDKSLSHTTANKGVKKQKDRITVALCCNSDGSKKLKPFVIGKAARPRCFRNFNALSYVTYASNKNAWMTSQLFDQWLHEFDRSMRLKKRKVLLLLDNATCHKPIDDVTNIELHYLPPTTTSHLQPMDAGIIQSFKSKYRRQHLASVIDQIDDDKDTAIQLDDAIRYLRRAWDQVTSETMANCWKHTGLFIGPVLPAESPESDLEDAINGYREVCQPDADVITPYEYVNVDQTLATEGELTDADIISSVSSREEDENDEE